MTRTSTRPDKQRSRRAEGRPPAPALYEPKPSRVDWRPLAALIDFSERSDQHSGRPALEQAPILDCTQLRRLGAGEPGGALIEVRSHDGALAVTVMARTVYQPDGGTLRLAWEHRPAVGEPVVLTQTMAMKAINTGVVGHPRHSPICTHCGTTVRQIIWVVHTWACTGCTTMRGEAMRLRRPYTLDKQSRALRAKLGLQPVPLTPIVVKGRKHVALAEKLWALELELMAEAAKGGPR